MSVVTWTSRWRVMVSVCVCFCGVCFVCVCGGGGAHACLIACVCVCSVNGGSVNEFLFFLFLKSPYQIDIKISGTFNRKNVLLRIMFL